MSSAVRCLLVTGRTPPRLPVTPPPRCPTCLSGTTRVGGCLRRWHERSRRPPIAAWCESTAILSLPFSLVQTLGWPLPSRSRCTDGRRWREARGGASCRHRRGLIDVQAASVAVAGRQQRRLHLGQVPADRHAGAVPLFSRQRPGRRRVLPLPPPPPVHLHPFPGHATSRPRWRKLVAEAVGSQAVGYHCPGAGFEAGKGAGRRAGSGGRRRGWHRVAGRRGHERARRCDEAKAAAQECRSNRHRAPTSAMTSVCLPALQRSDPAGALPWCGARLRRTPWLRQWYSTARCLTTETVRSPGTGLGGDGLRHGAT